MMRRWHVATILCMLLVSLLPLRPTVAEQGQTAIWRGVWNDADLTVAVVARGHGISDQAMDTEPWWRWGNTETDAYLFYWNSDSYVDLVLDFTREDDRLVARLYIPTLQEQRLAIQYGNGSYTRPEGMLPTLTLWPRDADAGWLINGLANFNLEGREMDHGTGQIKWSWLVGGSEPGIATWSIRSVLPGIDPDAGYPHFQSSSRMDPSVPFELAAPLMPSWPYLSAIQKEPHYGKIQPIYFDSVRRAIVVNWDGFHIAGMYQINSISYPPYVNFEAPFAFYKFDQSGGLYANLAIRSDVWPVLDGPQPTYETGVRMSWTTEDNTLWRYSLTAAANHSPEYEVTIGDTVIYAVPYSEYPSWIASKPWKAVTFVEATEGASGSEGIYDYSVEDNPPVTRWINGEDTVPPIDVNLPAFEEATPSLKDLAGDPLATFRSPYIQFPSIHPLRLSDGFRGEYSLTYNRIPQLYVSNIDNRVHLLYAEEGIWNLGNEHVLRSYNLNDSAFINGWTRERVATRNATIMDDVVVALPGRIEESLYALDGFFIYSSLDTFVLRRPVDLPHITDVQVPTDSTSWEGFLAATGSSVGLPRDPNDLESWLDAFPGQQLRISGAQASDFRATDDGFRFVLRIKRSARIDEANVLDLSGVQPGVYVVTYNGDFSIVPITPPAISGELSEVTASQFRPLNLTTTIRNSGLRDIPDATLEILLKSAHGEAEAELIVTQPITLLAETTIVETTTWVPWESGAWTLIPQVVLPNGNTIQLSPTDVTVPPDPEVRMTAAMTVSSTSLGVIAAGCGFVAFVTIVGVISWRIWKPSQMKRGGDVT